MPSREINRRLWMSYDWRQGGEEWSKTWGGTHNLWHGTLMPRIGPFPENVAAVEIAPGHGRLTSYLKDYCSSLALVDIAPNCIEFCRRRFADQPHLEYFLNDGHSLPFIRDGSVDFVFSFDSLVHADLETMAAYLAEIERVLSANGRAVLHHSNLASIAGQEKAVDRRASLHLRAPDVSADLVLAAISGLDTLECRTQELISWDETGRLIDCISTFGKCRPRDKVSTNRFANADFYLRAKELGALSERYRS